MNPKINGVLANIRQHLVESIVPVQSVTNPNAFGEDVDGLDSFMAESAAFVARETGLSEDEALDVVFQVAEAGEDAGALPPLPAADAPLSEIEEWLDAATETGFAEQAVMSLIEDDQEEAIRIGLPGVTDKTSADKKQAARDNRAAYVKTLRKSKSRDTAWDKGAIYTAAGAKKKGQQAYDYANDAWAKARAAKQEALQDLIAKATGQVEARRMDKEMKKGHLMPGDIDVHKLDNAPGAPADRPAMAARRQGILVKHGHNAAGVLNPSAHKAANVLRPNALKSPAKRR